MIIFSNVQASQNGNKVDESNTSKEERQTSPELPAPEDINNHSQDEDKPDINRRWPGFRW